MRLLSHISYLAKENSQVSLGVVLRAGFVHLFPFFKTFVAQVQPFEKLVGQRG